MVKKPSLAGGKGPPKTAARKSVKKPEAVVNDDIGEEVRLQLWRSLLEIRHVEQRAHDLFLQNLIKGTSHLALGPIAPRAICTECWKMTTGAFAHIVAITIRSPVGHRWRVFWGN